MLDWHPSAQNGEGKMVDAPRRDRPNVALESLLSHVSRALSGRGTILNGLVHEGAKRWGRGDEMCIAWSRSTVDYDKRVVGSKT